MRSDLKVVVVGAGMAGVSAAWHLAEHASVTVLEAEATAGYHASGRSAALLTEVIGPPAVRALVRAGRPFLTDPPADFAEHPLLSPVGVLLIARSSDVSILRRQIQLAAAQGIDLHCLSSDQCQQLVPVLKPDAAELGAHEPTASSIDVDALLQGFVRGALQRGTEFHFEAPVTKLTWSGGSWTVRSGASTWECDVVVNAAGAWCDQLAVLAGLEPLGLRPLRRSVFVFPPPAGVPISSWPLVADVGGRFYFEPWGGLLLASPADETLSEPCDAKPQEIDIALGVEEIHRATSLQVRGVRSTWAGLRTFAPDGVPVAGFDPDCDGFFWLAGQGGYGIKTSPALGQFTAAMITGAVQPPQLDLANQEISAADLSPTRFR